MLISSVVCPQNQFQHHAVQQFWRKTAFSSTSCPTWAAPGSKPPAMRQRHRRPWPPCGLRVLSPSRSPCTSPVVQMALSGQPHSDTGRVAYYIAVVVYLWACFETNETEPSGYCSCVREAHKKVKLYIIYCLVKAAVYRNLEINQDNIKRYAC